MQCWVCEDEGGWWEITDDLEVDEEGDVVGNTREWVLCPVGGR